MNGFEKLKRCYDRFLFETLHPSTCVLLRVCYGILLSIYAGVLWMDGSHWFSDAGVLQRENAIALINDGQWSLFFWFPATPTLVQSCLLLLMLNGLLMVLGCWSRVQAACAFFLLVSFQNRNTLICDGEDTVFRLFALFLVLMPLDYAWSLLRRGRDSRDLSHARTAAWALRLVQLEMCLIYLSAAYSKCLGSSWKDGSALFYVYQMGDLYGKWPLPAWVTESELAIQWSTWAVVVVEAVLPFALCWRPTRKPAIVVAIGLHLSMEYAMNLFLFQWIMIVGILSFINPDEWRRGSSDSDLETEAADPAQPGPIHSQPAPSTG